jgi:hypothetical protein
MKEDGFLAAQHFVGAVSVTEVSRSHYVNDDCKTARNWNKFYGMVYLSTAIGLTPGGSSTVHIYTQTIYRTTQIT